MRLCIPTETKDGLSAPVFGHFGSAPFFTVYDTDKEQLEVIDNANAHHEHGMCHPVGAIGNARVDIVVCQGMGRRAVEKLNDAGIKAFRQSGGTVADVLRRYAAGDLEELTVDNACSHHGGCH